MAMRIVMVRMTAHTLAGILDTEFTLTEVSVALSEA